MGYSHGHCKIGDTQIEYLDTGVPSTESYRTFLLVPGAAHTACT
jgi:hypothetical protein